MSDSELPDLCRDSDSENSDAWDEDSDAEESPTLCLFCEKSSKSTEDAILHVETEHKLSFQDLQIKLNLDQYGFIKMVNYIRTNKSTAQDINQLSSCPWDDEKYLKPCDETRVEWLMFDYEEQYNSSTAKKSNKDNQMVSISQLELNDLKNTTRDLQSEVKHLNSLLEDMRKQFRNNSEKLLNELEREAKDKPKNCVAAVKCSEDEFYFSSYAGYDIHHEMLSDVVRTKSYEEAILRNAATLSGKTVLDLGCGSGILSMFCSKAGAAQVISIDQSEIIYKAMDICRANGIDNVKLVKGRLEDTEIGVDKVDVIVSEWMGYFLLFEGMMDSLIYARDRHLKEGGLLLPNRCNMSLVALGDESRHKELVGFWDDVYGFDMRSLQPEVLKDGSVEICNAKWILTEPNVIADIDLMTATTESCNFTYDFKLKVVTDGKVTCFVGYFDTFFELPHRVEFSTGPQATPTHWKQTAFYLKDVVPVSAGQVIEGTLKCRRHAKEVRSLAVTISVFGQTNQYTIN